MRASECLDVDTMSSRYFLLELEIKLDFSIIHFFLFFGLLDFNLFLFDFLFFLLSFEDSFPGRFGLNIFLRLEVEEISG